MKFEIIGYSGHSYVVLESALRLNLNCIGYYDESSKEHNIYKLKYLGSEKGKTFVHPLFICIGNNKIRRSIYEKLLSFKTISIIDPTANISTKTEISNELVYIGKSAIINPNSIIHRGVIINTNSIIEHDCIIEGFSHIAPSAIICGNVKIGKNTLVGANATILPGLTVGDNVTIGAGSVVTKDIMSNAKVIGNPARKV